MLDNSENLREIKKSLDEIKNNQMIFEKQFGFILIIILCLLIFIFFGLISIVEVTRNDVFENLKSLFLIIVIISIIFGLYKYFQVGSKEAKLRINSKKKEGKEINIIKKFFIYLEQYFTLTSLLFAVLFPSIVIYFLLSLLGF